MRQPNCRFSTPRVINVERTLSNFTIMMVMLQCGTVMTLIIYNTISHITQPWWLHYMETFSALLALCAGNSPVTGEFPHKGQWCRALMFSLICAWIRGWVNNREAGDLRCHRTHYDVIVMALTTVKHRTGAKLITVVSIYEKIDHVMTVMKFGDLWLNVDLWSHMPT